MTWWNSHCLFPVGESWDSLSSACGLGFIMLLVQFLMFAISGCSKVIGWIVQTENTACSPESP